MEICFGPCNLLFLFCLNFPFFFQNYDCPSPNTPGIWNETLSSQSISANQVVDSITLKGRFVWRDSLISGYPTAVKITSFVDPALKVVQKVDSLGKFEQKVVPGKFIIAPQLNYHWVGEELIRIDAEKSTLTLDVSKGLEEEIVITLDTIGWPINTQQTGLLRKAGVINFNRVDDFMQERMAFFEIPGASISVIKDEKVVYYQIYGVTNSDTQKPVTPQTLFEAGSITKLVFAFAVMRLYERGEINLDKPLYEYLPSDEIDDERYHLMTARHVLSHQSGLSNWPKKDARGKFKLKFAPGTQFGYSGKAFEYLKLVLERITAKSIDDILQEEVLEPLKITDMHFKGDSTIAEYGSNGHKKYIPSAIFLAKKTMVVYTLQTTSEALAKFAIALHQRKGLKPETYHEMFKVHSERSDGTKWGLGVRIEDTSLGTSYGHSGSTGRGFISNLVFYDDNGLGYVILTNCQMGGWLSLPLLNEYLILGKRARH